MAQRQLQPDRRTAIGISLFFLAAPMMGCAHQGTGLGLSLSFFNRGTRPLTHLRFDFDGKRGPMSGYLAPEGGGAHMGFMPGDRQGGTPQAVEVEWIIYSPEFFSWSENAKDSERYSKENEEIYKNLWATNRHYIQRVDLTPIITPEIVARVRADRKNTHMKMTVTFRDDQVDITAGPYKWR